MFEEAGLSVDVGRVIDVHSTHFTGARPDGVVEDYHAVHLIFETALSAGSEGDDPTVVEVGGSTDLAAWVEFGALADLRLTDVVHHVLGLIGQGGRS